MVERRASGELRWEAAGLGRLEVGQLTAERTGRSARSVYLATSRGPKLELGMTIKEGDSYWSSPDHFGCTHYCLVS